MRRRWGRRLPRVSQYPNQALGANFSAQAPNANTPINYSSNWLELKELLFRIQLLESASTSFAYVVSALYNGKPTASMRFIDHAFPAGHNFTLAAGCTNSICLLRTAATAQSDYDLQKTGVSIGTIRFAAAGTVATYVGVSAQTFTGGTDDVRVIAPASVDGAASNPTFTLYFMRS